MWDCEPEDQLMRDASHLRIDFSDWSDEDLSRHRLNEPNGIERLTASLFDYLIHMKRNQSFRARLKDQNGKHASVPSDRHLRVLVVPGGFHRSDVNSRNSLSLVVQQLRQLGFSVVVADVPNLAPKQDNAIAIADSTSAMDVSPYCIVSLSKGSCDVYQAMNDFPGSFKHCQFWIDVSGLLTGSAWVSNVLRRIHLNAFARLWLTLKGDSFTALRELQRSNSNPETTLTIPVENCCAIHIIGFPLFEHLTHRYARLSYQRLARIGPSDGMGVMLIDTLRLPGVVVPIWGADHFLRPPGAKMSEFIGSVAGLVDQESSTLDSRSAAKLVDGPEEIA